MAQRTVEATRAADEAAPYRIVVEASILLLQFSMGLSFLAVAPLFPLIITTFGIDNATVSLLVGVSSLSVGLALVPASILAARLGSRWSLVLGGVLMGLTGLSLFAESFPLLLATRVSFALGAALNMSATPAVLLRWFPVKELAMVNGANVVAQSLGVMISMLLGPILAGALDWDGALSLYGAVALVSTALWIVLGRDRGGSSPTAAPFQVSDLSAVLGNRVVVLLSIGLAGALGAYISLQSWLPTFWTEERGYTLEQAGLLSALLSLFGILGAVIGSALPVRVPTRRPFLLAGGLGIPLFAAGAILLDAPLLFVAIAVLGIVGWVFMPVVFTIPMEIPGMNGARVGIAVAMVLGAGNLAGFFIPLMVGYLRDQTGSFVLGLSIACSLALVMVACTALMPETGTPTRTGR